jgi:hypothetical protein
MQLDFNGLDLSYRDNSMIDYADQVIKHQSDVVILDEHYRSAPDIINFSNKKFYNNTLRIMTERPVFQSTKAIEIVRVEPTPKVKGVIEKEAFHIIERLKQFVSEQSVLPDEYKLSIGVLSFFSDQAKFLQQLIFDEFSIDIITAHKLRSGTPYAFQGEEREIMLVSCGIDEAATDGTYTYLNRPDVFNVAITRARAKQIVFLSSNNIKKSSLLSEYIEYIGKKDTYFPTHNIARDTQIDNIVRELQNENITVMRNYPIAGITMDLVAIHRSICIAIDLIGFPGEYEDALHLEHYKIFERAGLNIFPISFTAWIFMKETIVQKLKQAFHEQLNSDITNININKLSTHIEKLMQISPDLGPIIRKLEFELVELNFRQGIDQLAQLIDQYYKFIWILQKKLSPNELTYLRYSDIAEGAVIGVLDNINKVLHIKKSIDADRKLIGADDFEQRREILKSQQTDYINELIKNNAKAIVTLEEITLKWSRTNTGANQSDENFQYLLKELSRLRDLVEHYSAKND